MEFRNDEVLEVVLEEVLEVGMAASIPLRLPIFFSYRRKLINTNLTGTSYIPILTANDRLRNRRFFRKKLSIY